MKRGKAKEFERAHGKSEKTKTNLQFQGEEKEYTRRRRRIAEYER